MQSYLPSSSRIVCRETNVYKHRHYSSFDCVAVFEFTSAISEAYAWTFVLILAAEGCVGFASRILWIVKTEVY